MISDAPDGAILTVKVIPRAGRTAIAGARDNALLIRLAAAPVDGAANAALLAVAILAVGNPDLTAQLAEYRRALAEETLKG